MTIRTTTHRSLLCFFAAALAMGCGKKEYSGPLNEFRRYELRNVHATYDFLGNARGSEELFIADYGKYEARYSKYELLTTEAIRPMANAGITRLTDVYSIDPIQKKVMHLRATELDSLYHLSEGSIPTATQFLDKSMKDNLLRQTGTDSVAGFLATRWEARDGSIQLWLWKGILLKKLTQTRDGLIGTQLTGLDTAWVVDTAKFGLPRSGFEFVEQPQKK